MLEIWWAGRLANLALRQAGLSVALRAPLALAAERRYFGRTQTAARGDMTNSDPRPEPYVAAQLLWSQRYPSASVVFCGGSVVRGEGFPASDLDVVVLFGHVANAWRESFQFEGWPVEVFAHDAQTLAYFVAQD